MAKKYINLLPQEHQRHIKTARLNAQLLRFGIWLILSVLIFSTILFAAFLVLNQKLSALEEEVSIQSSLLEQASETSVRKEVEQYNQNQKNFETLLKSRDNWSVVFRELALSLPQDMAVERMSINRSDRKIEVSGRAAARDSVLQFRKNLIDSGHFAHVNFPLANLEKPQNVSWKYRFYAKEEFLK